jgi:hypothetical protein
MKKTLMMLVFVASALRAHAYFHDAAGRAQYGVSEIMNYAKMVETQLNTLNTYEQQVVQLARMGNPAALRSLPGVSTVAELYQTYGELQRGYATTQALLNPGRYQNDMNYILGTYRLPTWNGFTTANGLPVLPAQGAFQFQTGSWNVANSTLQQWQALDDQRQRLQQQRDQALSALQGATTQSEVQKYHGVVDALNGAIAEVAHAQQNLYQRSILQNQQLQAGQQIYNATQAERRAAADYQVIDAGINALPMGSFRKPVYWGVTP